MAEEYREPVDHYLRLPYTVETQKTAEGYFAKVVEVPGCMTWAESLDGLERMVGDAATAWIEDAVEDGDSIHEPVDTSVRRFEEVQRRLRESKE